MSMAIVLCTAGVMWQAKGHVFLVPLGFVSAYLIFNGWRVIARRKRKERGSVDDRVDMLAACGVIAAGLVTAYIGARADTPLLLSIRPALYGIGGIACCFGVNDLVGFRQPRSRHGWVLAHLAAMIAAYISATTAFLVINAHHVPMILRWLVPSVVGIGFIATYSLREIRHSLSIERAIGKRNATSVASATADREQLVLD